MEYKLYNKLVRDRIPEIIKVSEKAFRTQQLTADEYIKELNKKAFEELNELIQANNKQEVSEELADLLEVVYALADFHGFSFNEIENIRMKKAKDRGSFSDRVYLIDVEV